MVIGVTGGIGSGKSLFTREMGKLGAHVIDADKVARKLIDQNKALRIQLKENFGFEMFDDKDNLQRRKLGKLVFAHSDLLKQLNSIIHEPLLNKIKECIKNIQDKYNNCIIVVDMAIIFEAGAESMFDYIITVDAPLDMRIIRLEQDRGWTKKEIKDRISSQMNVREKIEKSDFVVKNNGSAKELKLKASKLFSLIQSLSVEKNNN